MKKYFGTRYNSVWDTSTWIILFLGCGFCVLPIIWAPELLVFIIMIPMILFILLTFIGIYYRIDGNNLVVYQLFVPKAYPIDKISEIKPTKSILSSPAASLKQRLAIKFSDKNILKSQIPLIISPVRQKEFLTQLLSLNPDIQLKF